MQSSFPEELLGEISGLSRAVSNLGSSFGTAIAGTILVSDLASGNRSYSLAMAALAVIGLVGLAAALFLPAKLDRQVGLRGRIFRGFAVTWSRAAVGPLSPLSKVCSPAIAGSDRRTVS